MLEPYEVLGISRGATLTEVRAQYRKMAAKYHPDRGIDPWVFKLVRAAYEHACYEIDPTWNTQTDPEASTDTTAEPDRSGSDSDRVHQETRNSKAASVSETTLNPGKWLPWILGFIGAFIAAQIWGEGWIPYIGGIVFAVIGSFLWMLLKQLTLSFWKLTCRLAENGISRARTLTWDSSSCGGGLVAGIVIAAGATIFLGAFPFWGAVSFIALCGVTAGLFGPKESKLPEDPKPDTASR